jgi:hypothetical protein
MFLTILISPDKKELIHGIFLFLTHSQPNICNFSKIQCKQKYIMFTIYLEMKKMVSKSIIAKSFSYFHFIST